MGTAVTTSRAEEARERRAFLESTFALSRSLGIRTLIVQAYGHAERHMVERFRDRERLVWVARSGRSFRRASEPQDEVITVPDTTLSRVSQLNLTVFLAALNGCINPQERVLVLYGLSVNRLDTLALIRPRETIRGWHITR